MLKSLGTWQKFVALQLPQLEKVAVMVVAGSVELVPLDATVAHTAEPPLGVTATTSPTLGAKLEGSVAVTDPPVEQFVSVKML